MYVYIHICKYTTQTHKTSMYIHITQTHKASTDFLSDFQVD